MGGKVYDRNPLIVDRNPTKQLAVEVGHLAKLNPAEMIAIALENFVKQLEDFGLAAIQQVTGVDLSGLKIVLDNLGALLGNIDLFGIDFDVAAALLQFIASFPAGVLANWGDLFEKLVGQPSPEDALDALANFFKVQLGSAIASWRLPLLPLSHIRNVNPDLLSDGSFDNEATLDGFLDWDWDGVDGRTKPGCAYTMADGITHTIFSNAIEVGVDDKMDAEVWAKWTGLTTAGAGPVRLAITSYRSDDSMIGGAPAIVATAGDSADSGWTKLSTAGWPVPADATYIVLELSVAAWATAGAVRFDDASLRKSGAMPQNYVAELVDDLNALLGWVTGLLDDIAGKLGVDEWDDWLTDQWQDLLDGVKGGVGGVIGDVISKLQNISATGQFDAGALVGEVAQDAVAGLTDLANNVVDGFKGIFNGWHGGTAGTGTAAEVVATMEAIKDAVLHGYNVVTFVANETGVAVPQHTEAIGILIGGGQNGAHGNGTRKGGLHGSYYATQLDLTGIDYLDIAVATPGNVSYIRTASATPHTGIVLARSPDHGIVGSITTVFGLTPTNSTPGSGGNGGNNTSASNPAPTTSGENSGLALGGIGYTGSSGRDGGDGGSVSAASAVKCGGAGGGGGEYQSNPLFGAGGGGDGGFPGGGGGGGGYSAVASGGGGTGGQGVVWLFTR